MGTAANYISLADKLAKRITVLIPAHPEILEMADPWKLFKIKDFKCRDLGPSLAQAGWALAIAKKRHRDTKDD